MKLLREATRKLRRPTYAEVVATLALFIALGGASYAAVQIPKNSVGTKELKKKAVGTKQLKKAAVGTKQLKKNAVTSASVKDGSLLARDFKAGQLPRGATGPRGPAGADGATGSQGLPGADGTTGPQGPQGVPGDQGPVGPSGTQGPPGETGSAASAVTMGMTNLPSVSTPLDFPPSGIGEPSADTNAVAMITPAVPVSVGNLSISLGTPPGNMRRRVFRLVHLDPPGGVVLLSCSIDGDSTACSDQGTKTVPANSRIVFTAFATQGTPAATSVRFAYTVGAPD